jgi:ABC-type lipoprotein export system ATPase subunit
MKQIKIRKIHIYNFKIFNDEKIDLNDSDVVILDGPNGYGKTSFFDAVELLLTGEINRLVRKKNDLDLRKNFQDNLLVNDSALDETFVKAEIEVNGEAIVISRHAKWNIDGKNNPTDFSEFNIFKLDSFEDSVEGADFYPPENVDELLGQGFRESYPVMHYVEQDESAFLLKRKEGDRTEFLSYLFHTVEEEEEYLNIRNKLNHLKDLDKKISKDIEVKKTEVKELKSELIINKIKDISYDEIFSKVIVDWDEEDFSFGYQKWDSIYKPEVKSIVFMVDNHVDIKQARINKFLEKFKNNKRLMKYHVSTSHFEESLDLFNEKESVKKYLMGASVRLDAIKGFSSLSKMNFEKIFDNVKVSAKFRSDFLDTLSDFRQRDKDVGVEEQYLLSVQSDRENLEAHLNSDHINNDTDCLFCGQSYENAESLRLGIKKITESIDKNLSRKVSKLKKDIEKFNDSKIGKLLSIIASQIEMLEKEMPRSYHDLLIFEQKIIDEYKTFKRGVKVLQINIDDFVNTDLLMTNDELEDVSEELKIVLASNIKAVGEEFYNQKYMDILKDLFDNKVSMLKNFDKNRLLKKIEYVENEIAKKQNIKILKLESLIKRKSEQSKGFAPVISDVKKIVKVYEEKINKYKARVISAIEIPFYIYSGRIIQTFNRGSGFFIDIDIEKELKGVKFKTDLNSSHDALFSLSSGQLSILVISFMLALNRVYAQNNLILIDDPVQSMDEVNISSLIELLRSDFSNYHIILSTHEEHVSLYMDYKFECSGIKSNCLNMKNLKMK